MTYNEWLNTLVSPIQYFLNWLIEIADSLISNYFFITLLGITLFISLVWFLFYLVFDFIDKINNRYDDYNDKYYNYELLKEVQSDYLDKHYTDEYDYRYRSKVLNLQVSNGVLQQNPDLVSNFKESNYKADVRALKDMQYDNLTDDNPYNDNDTSIISNMPKVELAKKKELDNFERNDLFNNAYDYANRNFLNKHGIFIDKDSNNYIDSSTGEILSFEEVQKRIHNDNFNNNILSNIEKTDFLTKAFLAHDSKGLKVDNIKLRSNILDTYDSLDRME